MGSKPNKEWGTNSDHPQLTEIDPIIVTPYITDTERVFTDENTIKLTSDTKGADIYYSLNSSEPDKNSQLYTAPFTVNKTTTVKMVAYKGEQKSLTSSAVINKLGEIKTVHLNELEAGISYKYTHGIYRMVNDFLDVTPLKTGVLPNFTIEPKEKEQFFSFDYEGYINIPEEGEYIFYLATNDGGRFYIDNFMLINNDGLHPVVEVQKAIKLKAGLHPISVKYFQEGGRNGLTVSWKGPGIEKEEIPESVLFH